MPLWERLLTAQVQGRSDARERTRLETRPVNRPEKSRTKIIQRNDIIIRRSEIVLDEADGELKELMIKSASSFGIEIRVDDRQLLHKTMPELIEVSEDIGGIVAVFREGYYRFSISDIHFEKIFLRVFLEGSGTFDIYKKVSSHAR